MKKILALLPLLFAFLLISCNDDNNYIENSSDTPTNESTIDEEKNTGNINDNSIDDSTTEEKEKESPLPDYEDDTEWKGKIF